jgi:AcrR family transcriptional regulator
MGSDSSTGTPRRGPYAKSAERRRSIVEAAFWVFATKGYLAGSLQDVADRVGMSQTSLLHYFPTKSDLLIAALDWRDSITGDGSAPPDPEEGLADGVVRQATFNQHYPGAIELYTVLCAESATAAHPGRDYFVRRFTSLRSGYGGEFAKLASAGRLREGVVPERAAATLVALWDGIQLQWLLDPENVDMVAVLRDYLDLVILPEGGTP